MSNACTTLALVLVAAFAVSAATPTLASKNDHRYAKSAEAMKKQEFDIMCAGMKDNLQTAEANADDRAGTKAAAKWAKIADGIWADAHAAGCSWAA